MFLSIIVPIYNVEKYLDKCINSVLNQSDRDFELIMIDDCSSDKSFTIASKYSDINNVKLIKKETNSGLSDTRNLGLKVASGEYVMFLDSDDYIEEDSVSRIKLDILNNNYPDVSYYGFFKETADKSVLLYGSVSQKGLKYTNVDYMKNELRNRRLSPAACFGVYNRNFIISNNLFFKSGILHEDELWTPQVLLHANGVYVSEYAYYHYVKRDNSITTKKDKTKNSIDIINTCYELETIFDEVEDKKLKILLNNHLSMLYMKAMTIGKMYEKNKKKYIDKFFPIKKAYLFQERMKALLFLFDLRIYCFLNNLKKGDL